MTGRQDDAEKLHVQDVCQSEIKQLFFQHVRSVVFQQHELTTSQSLLVDYNTLLRKFDFDPVSTKSTYIKEILQKEFGTDIGFHDWLRKNTICITGPVNRYKVMSQRPPKRRLVLETAKQVQFHCVRQTFCVGKCQLLKC